ncbi:ABC transporter permease [Alkalihalobacillus sp. FSL R5-0424]
MKELFIERYQQSMRQNMKLLTKAFSHSGVFGVVPFAMLLMYVVVMFLRDESYESYYHSIVLTGIFFLFVLNKGIISFINQYDEVYLAPKIMHMGGYFRCIIAFNIGIQSVKVTVFTVFLYYVYSLGIGELMALFILMQLVGMLHILSLILMISISSKRPTLLSFVYHLSLIVSFLFLLEAPSLFIVIAVAGILLIGILYHKHLIFPIHSWQRLIVSEERSVRLALLLLSSVIDVKVTARSWNLVPLWFFEKKEDPMVYFLLRSAVRGTEVGRHFVRVILVMSLLTFFVNNMIVLIPVLALALYFNSVQFNQGLNQAGYISVHYPIQERQVESAKDYLKMRAVLVQSVIVVVVFGLKYI